jgi:hypothetical protein
VTQSYDADFWRQCAEEAWTHAQAMDLPAAKRELIALVFGHISSARKRLAESCSLQRCDRRGALPAPAVRNTLNPRWQFALTQAEKLRPFLPHCRSGRAWRLSMFAARGFCAEAPRE